MVLTKHGVYSKKNSNHIENHNPLTRGNRKEIDMCNNGCYGCDQLTDDNACLLGALRGMKRCKRTAEETKPEQAEEPSLSEKCECDELRDKLRQKVEFCRECGSDAVKELQSLQDIIKELEDDKERLDFLDDHVSSISGDDAISYKIIYDISFDTGWLREAIDKARK